MCIKKLKNILLKKKASLDQKEILAGEANTLQTIDLKINYNKSYFCDYLKKRHLVQNFNIQNISNIKHTFQVSILPSGKLIKEIKHHFAEKKHGYIIFSNTTGGKEIFASLDDNPFEIHANSIENHTIIVRDFNINSDLQLEAKSDKEVTRIPIDTNIIHTKK